ncbi:MAG: amino acid adenylation domain-containing protein, partial [Pirellulaceae bacterium]
MNAVHLLEHLRSQGIELRIEGDRLRYRAPRRLLTPGLLTQLRDHKPDLLQLLRRAPGGETDTSAGTTPNGFPLSHGQRALWFLHQRDPRSAAYHVAFATRIRSPLEVDDLRLALERLLERHPSLRTTYTVREGRPVQSVQKQAGLSFQQVDAGECALEELRQQVVESYRQPFDLERGPLARACVFSRRPDDHVLLLTIHHIACDGWSLWLLQDELIEIYSAKRAGRPSRLPAPRFSYAEFVNWQSEMLNHSEGDAHWDYWRKQLRGDLPLLNLPTDRPRPPVQTDHGASLPFALPQTLTERLRCCARHEGATLYTILLAAFQVLLHRHTGQDDILVGSPAGGRNRAEFKDLVGFFVNPIVLRADLSGDPTFRDYLGRVRRVVLAALDHQDLPFPLLVERLKADRDLSRPPLFQVLFALQRPQMAAAVEQLVAPSQPEARIEWGDLILEPFEIPQQEGQFDLSLEMVETTQSLSGVFKYNTDLFDGATVDRLRHHFQTLLEDLVGNPEKRLSRLSLLDETERDRLLVERNATTTEYPRNRCIHELFADQARQTPHAIAVEFQDQRLSYQALNERANQLAHHLRQRGVGPETLVGTCVHRSLEMVIGLLGILKAGGAYVPLDPEYPHARLSYMLRESRAKLLLTQQRHLKQFGPFAGPVVCLDRDANRIANESTDEVSQRTLPTNLAYVMFTSGSTGQPKGVAVMHRGVVRLVRGCVYAEFRPDDVFLQFAPLSFDASTLEIWGSLLNGAKLVLAPAGPSSLEELGQVVRYCGITTLWLTAGLFHQQVDHGLEHFSGVRQWLAGGDVLSPSHVRRALARLPHCRVINGYGPTENTTFTSCFPMTSPSHVGHSVSIGRPLSNTRLYILDANLELAPEGVAGELYVAGDGLARGYFNRPEWTAERFVPDMFGSSPGERMYKTGDLVRWQPDGNLEFLGRLDHQVKVRGFRIEPEEIEKTLMEHDGIRDVAVVVHKDRLGLKRLVAYLVPRNCSKTMFPQHVPLSQGGPQGVPEECEVALAQAPGGLEGSSAEHLRSFLKGRLPDYMVPALFITLDTLPLNPNGKVDRHALPAPGVARPELSEPWVPPCTATEKALAEIWAPLLDVAEVGVHDNFFALGGHSLLATQMVSRIQQVLDVELPLLRLFESPTIAELVAVVDDAAQEAGEAIPRIEPARRDGELPLSYAQERLWFLHQLEPDSPFYNIPVAVRIRNSLDENVLRRCLQIIVQRHETLRTTFGVDHGRAIQKIANPTTLAVPVVDLRHLPDEPRESEVTRRSVAEANEPFDLTQGPLLRTQLLRVDESEYVFLLTMHHIVSDGWSMGVLVGELMGLYRTISAGTPPSLPGLPIQYADYAVWQRRSLAGPVRQKHLSYWRDQLDGVPVLQLPVDHPRPAVQTFRGANRSILLEAPLIESLEAISHQEGGTLYMTMLAAFQTLLHRYTGQEEIAVGSGFANRNRRELEGLIGFFVNLQIMRVNVCGNPSFRELVRRVRRVCLDAFAHQDLPFDMLVRELQPERTSNYNPLCRVCLVHQNFPLPELDFPGLSIREMNVGTGTAKFDLTLYLTPAPEGLIADVEYNTDLFESTTIDRMLGHLRTLLQSIAANPDRPLSELAILGEQERHTLLVDWNATQTDFPSEQCVHQLFESQVARSPDAKAIAYGDQELTYQQLNDRANRLAHHLRAMGVNRETPVAVCVDRSLELVSGILGILKAGGTYVPLDPEYPPDRLAFMLRDSQATVLVTERRHLQRLPEFAGNVVCLDVPAQSEMSLAVDNPECWSQPEDLAYVIYTSGSTGVPKGVAVPHRGLCNLVTAEGRVFHLGPADRVLQFSSTSFDASVWEIFATLCSGATLCLGPRSAMLPGDDLMGLLQRHAITIVTLPPSVLAALPPANLPDLRIVVSAGENCDPQLVRRWGKGRRFINAYGPTEGTVCATLTDCAPGLETAPIGRPIDNVQTHVLDAYLQPVPMGVTGELYLGGAGLARGYLNRPDLTAAAFIPNPFGPEGSRLYKTGDAVRWLSDGRLEFLGRLDQQVKIRGFRIELEEIEAVLCQHAAVSDAAVVLSEEQSDRKRLVAHVVSGSTQAGSSQALLQLKEERVTEWQHLYDENYRRSPAQTDPTFNIVGWEDSYTGEPFSPDTMREWVEQTVDRVLAWKPQHVLEIGCGTGLLLFPIATHCTEYLATDLSQTAIEYVRGHLESEASSLSHVRLATMAANGLRDLEVGSFDTVILNSVVQYFPDIDYLLDVLEAATDRVESGGRVFVGDVRCLPLLETLHTSIEMQRAGGAISRDDLRMCAGERERRDQELVIDPEFFHALKQRLPHISHVEVHLKRGRCSSELTKYRYDVLLYVGDSMPAEEEILWKDWREDAFSLPEVRRQLETGPPRFGLAGVPNTRLQSDLAVYRWLSTTGEPKTVAELRETLNGTEREGVDPETLWDMGDEYGYDVQVTWSESPADGNCDVVFRRCAPDSHSHGQTAFPPLRRTNSVDGPWAVFANDPLARKRTHNLITDLRTFLHQRLPDYMVPSVVNVLEEMPLTPSGKVDKRALLATEELRHSADRPFAAPRNEIENALAAVWCEVLGMECVGVHDNFFELGGDSILGIQVVARAKAQGLVCSPLQLFQFQTIAELAAVVEPAKETAVDQRDVVGPLELTPIQHWFFELEPAHPEHFNQSLLLETASDVDPDLLEQALFHLPWHHDALRLRFHFEDHAWRGTHDPRGSPDPDETSDIRARRGSPDPDETSDIRARRGS